MHFGLPLQKATVLGSAFRRGHQSGLGVLLTPYLSACEAFYVTGSLVLRRGVLKRPLLFLPVRERLPRVESATHPRTPQALLWHLFPLRGHPPLTAAVWDVLTPLALWASHEKDALRFSPERQKREGGERARMSSGSPP